MSHPLRIMIVEDEPMLAFQLEDEVVDAGYEFVGWAMSSAQASIMAREKHPDLVLLDYRLADGRTGIETAEELASSPTVVVFLTASAGELPEDLAGAAGVVDKPWTSTDLKAALNFLDLAIGRRIAPPPPRSLRLAPKCVVGANGLYSFA
jgi:DNA-binding response OmpR family regulator